MPARPIPTTKKHDGAGSFPAAFACKPLTGILAPSGDSTARPVLSQRFDGRPCRYLIRRADAVILALPGGGSTPG
jgi:hypothetical protein